MLISRPLKGLSLYGAAVFLLAFSYAMFVGDSIGRDLVILMGEFKSQFWYTLITSGIWTYIIWYSCRLLSYAKEQNNNNNIPVELLKHSPRLLSYNAIVMIQLCILHLQTIADLNGYWLVGLWVGMNLFYVLLHKTFTTDTRKLLWYTCSAVATLAYIGYLLSVWNSKSNIIPKAPTHEIWLPLKAIPFFILQIVSVWFFIRRKKGSGQMDSDEVIGTEKIPAFEKNYMTSFKVISLLAMIVYLLVVFNLQFSRAVGTFGFALLGFGVLIGFFNLMHFYSIRKNINVYFFILILAIIIGKYGRNPYMVHLEDTKQEMVYSKRPTVPNYFKAWVEKRMDKIRNANDSGYVVYFILSDGGSSRAAYWVSTLLGRLEDTSAQVFNHQDSLSNHIFCLAGASGGNVGNAVFYSLLTEKSKGLIKDGLYTYADSFLRSDFLTYSFGRYLGPDLLRHIIPWIPMNDRAAALEHAMEHAEYNKVVGNLFSRPMNEIFDTTTRFPMLFMNTTRVQDGRPGVVSSAQFEAPSMRIDVLNLVDSEKKVMHMSTGAVLGSRFPYLSPAGGIGNNFFVDGGYFDNSGSGTTLQVMIDIRKAMSTLFDTATVAMLKKKLRFKVLHLKNSSLKQSSITAIHPLVNDLATPVLTIAQIGNGNTFIFDNMLKAELRNQTFPALNYDSLSLSKPNDSMDYAMDWVLSDYQLNIMLDVMHQEVKDQFNIIFKDFEKPVK